MCVVIAIDIREKENVLLSVYICVYVCTRVLTFYFLILREVN